jgi:hypothetical protein
MIEAAMPPEGTTGGRRCAFPPYVFVFVFR